MTDLPSIFCVKNGGGERSIPPGERYLSKSLFSTCFFPVVGKDRLIAGKKPPHQDQISIVIEVHSHNFQPLRGVLLCHLIQHRVFVPAGLAPRSPKIHQQRFPAVLLHKFLVALRVDEFQIARRRTFGSLRPGECRHRGQHHKYDKHSPISHVIPSAFILSVPLPVEKPLPPAYNQVCCLPRPAGAWYKDFSPVVPRLSHAPPDCCPNKGDR